MSILHLIFLLSIIGLIAYLAASIGGWIDWLLWAPAVIADICVGWLCAMRINSGVDHAR